MREYTKTRQDKTGEERNERYERPKGKVFMIVSFWWLGGDGRGDGDGSVGGGCCGESGYGECGDNGDEY